MSKIAMTNSANNSDNQWKKTACILCNLNCGLEVKVSTANGESRILKIKGDKDHPVSQGYLCEKSQRLDAYQNTGDRLTSPLRRKSDGTFEKISWDVAIADIAQKFKSIKKQYGGDKIFYYGGGGQGNHLGGAYGTATLKAVGNKYRSNALAQEKTGEFWVNGKMIGSGVHGDYEHAEVALFIGKNPWQSHGFSRARACIRDLSKDPNRSLIVIDPRKSETAEKADYHLALKPGTDAWCLSALVAIIIQNNLVDTKWVQQHTTDFEVIAPIFKNIDVKKYADICGLEVPLLTEVAKKIASAKSVSTFEDLGMQMNVHSTLSSYIHRLIWLLTGNYGNKGSNNSPLPFLGLNNLSKSASAKNAKKSGAPIKKKKKISPVAGSKIIIGLVPCNVIPEEILTDHPNRYRAMIVESGNPVHSIADSKNMRKALQALELVVVIDVAMTETAREADYILPASSQFEKCEATFFNFEFPKNAFHLRQPLFEPLAGTLPEAEIHSRLLMAMGEVTKRDLLPFKVAANFGRTAVIASFIAGMAINKKVQRYPQIFLYKALGPLLGDKMAPSAVIWAFAFAFIKSNKLSAKNAGFTGNLFKASNDLFNAIINNPSGVVFSVEDYSASFKRILRPENKITLAINELIEELKKMDANPPIANKDYPFILSAGERRTDTTNTIIRDASALSKGLEGALRINPKDAKKIKATEGQMVRLKTLNGAVEVAIELTETMQQGHVSLPNGRGMDFTGNDGTSVKKGVAPNELTRSEDRDFLAGTPWHKHVRASIEAIEAVEAV